MWFGIHEVSGVVVWIAVVGFGSLATTDCSHCSGDLRSCGRVVKLVDLAASGGRCDENFIVLAPKTDFTIVMLWFLPTLARPFS